MSRFAIDSTTAIDRLKASKLAPASKTILLYALDRTFGDDEVALWIDEPWDEIDYADLESDDMVAATIFTEPLVLDDALTLHTEQLLGYHQARDGHVFVFLAPVQCTMLTTVPDCVAVFGQGLAVDQIACFSAPDATTVVQTRLAAKIVLSGRGDASVSIVPGTALEIHAFDSYLSSAAPLKDIVSPSLARMLDDEAAWEVMVSVIDDGLPDEDEDDDSSTNSVEDCSFLFTGRLASRVLTKAQAERAVERAGGTIATRVTDTLDYLVVGDARSALRGESAPSKKHAQALSYNDKGAEIRIISEADLFALLK